MKLIIQIPCFNEESTLPTTLADLPRQVDGFDRVEVLVIDDGSCDRTAEVAREAGADHVVTHTSNQGLARAFRTGLDACLRLGADVIVNTDADHQYRGADVPALVRPILEGRADIVIGDRRPPEVEHFSPLKRLLQRVGSAVVRRLSGLEVGDAVSGFRALSRDAALQTNIVSSFSYTIEMLIQAGRKGLTVASVPVGVNRVTRRSRLFRSIPEFVQRSVTTMLRVYAMYRPLRVFFGLGLTMALIGLAPIVRFLYFYVRGEGGGHVQSLVLGGVLLTIGFVTLLAGLLADLIAFNRQLVEITLEKVRRLELRLDEGAGGVTTAASEGKAQRATEERTVV
ncbi:MAG: glycosyltransferase family 2 protein [Thermoanaerobaculia bacterium]